jgi:hypothetical protein
MDEYPAAPGHFEARIHASEKRAPVKPCKGMNLDGRDNETDAEERNSTGHISGFVRG